MIEVTRVELRPHSTCFNCLNCFLNSPSRLLRSLSLFNILHYYFHYYNDYFHIVIIMFLNGDGEANETSPHSQRSLTYFSIFLTVVLKSMKKNHNLLPSKMEYSGRSKRIFFHITSCYSFQNPLKGCIWCRQG